MISEDGTIEIEWPPTLIVPRLTKNDFLATPLGKISRLWNENELWSRYAFEPVIINGEAFAMDICFCDDQLYLVGFISLRPEFDQTGQPFSFEKDYALHLFHKRFLEKQFDPAAEPRMPDDPTAEFGYRFSWGGVCAATNPKLDGRFIAIQYTSISHN